MAKVLSEGDKIEFRELILRAEEKAGRKANVYVSQVFEYDEKKKTLRVAMPISKGRLVPLPKGEMFDTFFYTSKGLYECRSKIIERYKSGNIYSLEISMETELQKYQRRQYYRLEKTLSLKYTQITQKEYITMLETKKLPEDMLKRERVADGTALDISGGGIRFVGKNLVPSGEKIMVFFDIFNQNGIVKFKLPATVILSFEVSGHSGKYEHRIEFENISKEYREILIKYIFEEERRMRNSSK